MAWCARTQQVVLVSLGIAVTLAPGIGCKSPATHHKEADKAALSAIREKQQQTFGTTQPFTIETPEQTLRRRLMIDQKLPHSSDASLSSRDVTLIKGWPEKPTTRPSTQPTTQQAAPLRINLLEALQIGAKNSREYQDQKEQIFRDALRLDLERDLFRPTFSGTVQGSVVHQRNPSGVDDTSLEGASRIGVDQRLRNGGRIAGALTFNVVQILTNDKGFAKGVGYEGSISIPLLAGAGEFVVMESLTQAERDLAYDLLDFQQYRRRFAVSIAQQYFNVLSQYDQIRNAEAAYRRAISSTRRARRQADAGRLTEIQVDQSVQQELRSRERWVQAQANLIRRLDSLRLVLGLPVDADVSLDPADLERLSEIVDRFVEPQAEAIAAASTQPTTQPVTDPMTEDLAVPRVGQGPGLLSLDRAEAVDLALRNRPDLRVRNGEVYDSQRKVRVAANALQAGLTLDGRARGGGAPSSARGEDVGFRDDEGRYSASLLLNLPLERTAERNAYRISLINYEKAVRDLQGFEDQLKSDVRATVNDLLLAREQIQIQAKSVAVAQRRVDSTNLFLDAGRAQVRDVLEAQDALVQAQNALTSALISYRLAELSLQRDMGVLEINSEGLWREYVPEAQGEQKK